MNRQVARTEQFRNRPNFLYKYDKGGIWNHWANSLFNEKYWDNWTAVWKNIKLYAFLIIIHKNKLQKHKKSNCTKEKKTVQALEEKMWIPFYSLCSKRLSNYDTDPEADAFDCIKIENLYIKKHHRQGQKTSEELE